ncbi:phosphotransferase [Amycolatopsis sp. NPDC004079]|uniref:phosphotransferase family protein n=1 Tax=Amycolatopsis sp. NPDC004079 TaxID=3154549 RepID=UPI0033A643FD
MPDDTLRALVESVCRRTGLDPAGFTRLRRHAADVILLPHAADGGLVLKAAPAHGADRAVRAVALTRWLHGRGFPCTHPAAVDQPMVVGNRVVTIWLHHDQHDRGIPGAAHLGTLLRSLHRLPLPPVELPEAQPLAGLADLIEADTALPPRNRKWLLQERSRLLERYRSLDFPLGSGLIHGDAYPGNTLWDNDGGTVLLGDWDEPALGPRELDLANTIQGRRFGRPPSEIDAFVDAYGYDPRKWEGLEVLTRIRDMHTLGSFLRRAAHGDQAAADELRTRAGSLRTGNDTDWHAA